MRVPLGQASERASVPQPECHPGPSAPYTGGRSRNELAWPPHGGSRLLFNTKEQGGGVETIKALVQRLSAFGLPGPELGGGHGEGR